MFEAGVFDPELLVERRANLEWGESARKVREDVGAVSQSEDGKTLRFTPGLQPQGTLWLRCDVSSLDAVAVTINGVAQTGRAQRAWRAIRTKGGQRGRLAHLSHPVASSLECKNSGNRPARTKATSRFWSHSATSATRRENDLKNLLYRGVDNRRVCSRRAPAKWVGCAAAQPDTTVAKVGDKEITRSDLDAAAAAEVLPLRLQVSEVYRAHLQRLIRDALFEQEAARRGITVEQLVEQEVTEHIDEPTEEMLRDVYQQHQADLGAYGFDVVRLRQHLMEQAQAERERAVIQSLEKKSQVERRLEPLRFEVDTEGVLYSVANAPVVVVAFSDFECPYRAPRGCRDAG